MPIRGSVRPATNVPLRSRRVDDNGAPARDPAELPASRRYLLQAESHSGSFEDTASALGFGVAVASWVTGLHDLVAGLLGTLGVISLAEHEVAMNSPTVWRTLIWTLMILYLIAFGVLFTKGVGASHRLGPARSAGIGIAAFVVYQAMFLVFNR